MCQGDTFRLELEHTADQGTPMVFRFMIDFLNNDPDAYVGTMRSSEPRKTHATVKIVYEDVKRKY